MLKNGIIISPIEIVRQRNGVVLTWPRRFVQNHDPVGVRIWKRTKQDRVDDTEYRGVRPDAECKRQDSDQSEPGRFAELAKSKLKIVHIIRRAGLELDRLAWRAGLESGRREERR